MISPPTAYSVLDFQHPGAAAALAVALEGWGYRRLWLGEHHSASQCANPLILGPLLAGLTRRIRIGSGGASLAYWNPYRLAEDARLIEFLLPRRFDLGVTRGLAPGGPVYDALTQAAPGSADGYHDRLALLHGLVTGRLPEGHPLAGRSFYLEPGPPMWTLGTSRATAALAGRLGTGFCFSLSHAPADLRPESIFAEYREKFSPSPEFTEPEAIVVLRFVCAATETEAERLAATANPPELREAGTIIGTPDHCLTRFGEIADRVSATEVMLIDIVRAPHAERCEMYRLIAEAAGIGTPGDARRPIGR